jgi:hypothetical protein
VNKTALVLGQCTELAIESIHGRLFNGRWRFGSLCFVAIKRQAKFPHRARHRSSDNHQPVSIGRQTLVRSGDPL